MASQGMFGPSGAEVELALREQQKQEAMQYASMPAGRGPVALMAQAGQGIGRAIEGAAGYQDPRVAKAKLLEEAKMEVDESGADLMADPKGYYESAFKALQSRGLTDEAMGVRQLMMQEEAQQALNAKNLRGTTKGFGASGNMLINKDDGSYTPMEGYQGKGSTGTPVTLSPPGSTTKGTGMEVTVLPGSEEFNSKIAEGWIDTSKIPGPERKGQSIEIKADFKQVEDQGKSRNKLAREMATPILDKARQSADVVRQTQMLRSQLESGNFDSGFLSTFRGFVSSAGQYLGMSDETLSELRQNPNDFNLLSSMTQNVVASTAAMLQDSGQLSKAELELYKASGSNMTQTAQGMYVVNEVMASVADWNVRRGEYLTELYARNPEVDTNDMQVMADLNKWEKANPLTISKEKLDRMKRHAAIVEKGKTAKDIKSVWSPEKGKNSATPGSLYRYRGGLYIYKGDTVVDGKVLPDLRLAK